MGTKIKLVLFLACLPYLLAKPYDYLDDEYVVVSPGPESSPAKDKITPNITSMHINSNITNRFSHTLIKSVVHNPSAEAQEATFFVVLTEEAFISSFVMEIEGKEYVASVQKKEDAKKNYDNAVSSGLSAAHVSVRDANKFVVSVNIEANSEATFNLVYEELLERTNGRYEQLINVHPGQIVPDLKIEVLIEEEIPISYTNVPAIRSGNAITNASQDLEPSAVITKRDERSVLITFSPSVEKQKAIAHGLGTNENKGMAGQFVVQYDVQRETDGGTVLVKDGHMVHFFAPSNLPSLKRHIVMILDTSGSMMGQKIDQLKEAMRCILNKMNSTDLITLINFSTNVKVWNFDAPAESTYFPQNSENVYESLDDASENLEDYSFPPTYPFTTFNHEKALNFVDQMEADGSTNIYDALKVGLYLIKLHQKRTQDKTYQPIICFLTDGEPTVGKVDTVQIVQGIAEENSDHVPINTLAFGDDANPDLLDKIGMTNHGIMRQIYIDSDTGIQLEDFFETTTNPQLRDVKFKYTPDVVSMTITDFPVYYAGSEIVIAAEIPEDGLRQPPVIECLGPFGPLVLIPVIIEIKPVGQLERLWAYKTEKMYLRKAKIAEANDTSPAEYNDKALALALKYSFVTPLTSLFVCKPNSTDVDAVDTTKANGQGDAGPWGGLSGVGVAYRPMMAMGGAMPKASASGPNVGAGPIYYSTPAVFPPPSSGASAVGGVDYAEDDMVEDDDVGAVPVDRTQNMEEILLDTTTTEVPLDATLPPELQAEFPWMKLRPDGSISNLKGTYKLGQNETSPVGSHCTTPSSTEGYCTLIKDCTKLYPCLKDAISFKDNFCNIGNGLAGICCPVGDIPKRCQVN